jgi:hypothetical protein
MPRSRIALWAALIAWPSISAGQQVSAIIDFLEPIVSKIASDPNSGGWAWEINRNGGYIVRKSMDVTGDGQPELFFASTLQSRRHEQTWAVFDVANDGTLRPYRTTLEHSSAWPIIAGDKTCLVYVMPPDKERMRESDEKPYPVSRFTFAFPEFNEALTYVSEAEATKLRPSDPGQLPKLQAILLADYLTKPEAKWADVTEWKLDSNDCFFRVEDKERAAMNTAFTPQVALSKIGAVRSSSASRSEQSAGNQPPTAVQQASPKRATEAMLKASPLQEESSPSTQWGFIVVLIVAATVFLWLLVNKRK